MTSTSDLATTTADKVLSEAERTEATAARHRSTRRRKVFRDVGVRSAVLLFTIFAWWAITAAGLIEPLFLPGPGAVWEAFVLANNCHPIATGLSREVCGEQGYYLWGHLLGSLGRIGVSIAIAVVGGVLLGFAMGLFRPVRIVLGPYLNFLRSLPPLGYIGLLIVWFGIGDVSKIWLLVLAAFPPITLGAIAGVDNIRIERLHAARSLGASWFQQLTTIVLPSSLPDVIGGIRIAVGFSWATVVAAELNAGIPGIGGLGYLAGTQLQTPLVIVCIIVIGIAAIVLDAAISALGRLLVPWQGKA